MRIVVFGGGMQGRVIAHNLASRKDDITVVVADIKQPDSLPAGVAFEQVDVLHEKQAVAAARGADACVLAVPSQIAHKALSNLIEAGVPVADVSFTPDPPLDLDNKARKTGACCVVDCGIAPGLSHLLIGRAHAELGGLDSVRILVGGMPQTPPALFRHAVYFNPQDLVSEYLRPARARKAGADISPSPFDVPVERYADGELGDLDAFLSDGLRSLLSSYPDIPEMAELTLRWQGHFDTMRTLRDLGLFDSEDSVSSVASSLGSKYPAEKHPDVLLMVVECRRGGERLAWRLIDRAAGGNSAMSRTTGFTTAAVAMVLARRQFSAAGVHPPERLGASMQVTEAIVADLAERKVHLSELLVPAKR